MVDFTKNKSWAATQVIEDDADAGNIGKATPTEFTGDVNTKELSGFFNIGASASNSPIAEIGGLVVSARDAANTVQAFISVQSNRMYFRRQISSVWQAWQEVYHTGNTSNTQFGGMLDGTENAVAIGVTANDGRVDISSDTDASIAKMIFWTPSGVAGSINTLSATTSYVTSSDPRLKDFAIPPEDSIIDTEFNKLFSCFKTFNWKTDPAGQLVWGFDAHLCIDAGLDMGSEGQGPRDLVLGDVYDTVPAELDEDDNEIKQPIDLRVSPAGIDQSKAVPILLAKIEQLERRLVAAGL
jgi:hypothetical protein